VREAPPGPLPAPWWAGEPDPQGRIMVISKPTGTGVAITFTRGDARIITAAPGLLDIARDLVEETVASGSSCDDPTLACTCFVCRAIRLLVDVEAGPGRCVICGCDESHACPPEGCGWADETKRICDRHPPEDIVTARLVLAREATS
jgi:hypothetical protein